MSGRGRALRTGIAFDMRTGMKSRGRKLVQDGERPGIWTERRNADERHPGRYVNVPPPDGLNYRPGPPPAHALGAKVDLSWVMQSDTHTVGLGFFSQPYGVLRKKPIDGIVVSCSPEALVIGNPTYLPDHALLWGGWELQWGGLDLVWGS